MEITGSVVVVTGAARGIGAALAEQLADRGAAAVVLADIEPAVLGATAAELGARFPRTRFSAVTCDVADPEAVTGLVVGAEREHGRIDVFVANAGVGAGGGLDAADAVWAQAWSVNVMAHVYAARAAVPGMLARGGGAFVTTASAAGMLTNLGNAPYSVTKHAALAFAEWLAITYGDQGLEVSCLCPMGVDTDLLRAGLGTLEGASVAAFGVLPVDVAAASMVEQLQEGRFLVLTHPEAAEYERRRVADRERWTAPDSLRSRRGG
jgi:NAD(P)-dependent dehydrogenase (short-subunit alcohol dehydrogenase family)